jgi:uncharacterized membrane protein
MLQQMLVEIGRQINAPFIVSGAVILAIALGISWWFFASYSGYGRLQRINASEKGFRNALVILAVVYFLVYSYLSVHRYYKLLCGAWDLGVFDSLMYNALHGRFFQDYRGPFDHFQPALALILPFYALWHDARLLLVVQSAVIALAAWPLYSLVKDITGRQVMGAVAGILYLLYPFLGAGNIYDFHGTCMTPLFFFSMLFFMMRRRWGLYWLSFALLALTGESEVILAFSAGLYLLSTRQYRIGAATVAISTAWFLLVTKALLPWMSGAATQWAAGPEVGAAAQWAATPEAGPLGTAAYLTRAAGLFCFAMLPVGFLPLRRWRTLLLVFGPYFVIVLVARSPYQNVFYGQYGLTLTAATLGAAALALEGLRGFSKDEKPTVWPLFLVILAGLSNLVYSWPANERLEHSATSFTIERSFNVLGMPVPMTKYRAGFYSQDNYEHFFTNVHGLFPRGTTVLAQNNLGCFFAVGYKLVGLKEWDKDAQADFYLSDKGWNKHAQADYYLFDPAHVDSMHDSAETLQYVLNRLNNDPRVVKFLDLSRPGQPGFAFYSAGDKWKAFYENAIKAHERDPKNPAFMAAIGEVERTLGLPQTLGRGAVEPGAHSQPQTALGLESTGQVIKP